MEVMDNVFFAKRKLVDNIYKSANLEGIAITIADTVDILNNVNNGIVTVDEMLKIIGLRDAWEKVLNTYNEELDINYIKNIHREICKGQNVYPLGEFRDIGVGITGTSWRPKLPSECNYEAELKEIIKIEDKLTRTLEIFCFIMRAQMFKDGNKRVANLIANKEMIKNGLGIINVPVELKGKFLEKLVQFYETGENAELKEFLIENCLDKL
jgi:Fic family protein